MKHLFSLLLFFALCACTKPYTSSWQPAHKVKFQDGERFISLNNIRYWVRVAGSQHQTTPIVIIHGGPGGNNYSFERTIGPQLEKFATVVYYEQRGCGRSEAPQNPEDYQLKTLISDLNILRDSLGVQKMNLLGYSFGGELGLRYAVAHQDQVEKLIVSAPAELSEANMLVQLQGFYASGDSSLKAGIRKILKDTTTLEQKYNRVWSISSSANVDRFLFAQPEKAALNRKLWQESKLKNTGLMAKVYLKHNKNDLIPTVSGLATPTLIISGAHDKNGGFHTGLALKKALPNNTFRIYENSAHFPDMEEPERFAADVKTFLGSK
ncbi:alpha/beta fold hydrolase [Adhaeribacter terreus]|uniref:Alpha/beta fold hydrolase n=1 Tax=Adhaeribacter terreus TaxID=529703 RepID=A0ABW0E915_9BACT